MCRQPFGVDWMLTRRTRLDRPGRFKDRDSCQGRRLAPAGRYPRPTNRPSCDRVRSKNGREELPIWAVGTPGTHPHPPVSSRRGGRVGVEPSAAPFADESRIGRGVVRQALDPLYQQLSIAGSGGRAYIGCAELERCRWVRLRR